MNIKFKPIPELFKQRNPNVGDKFASRAGQKGILSQKWPAEDLPFSETGLIPDIVFNPHGFPSRMTIAMMVSILYLPYITRTHQTRSTLSIQSF